MNDTRAHEPAHEPRMHMCTMTLSQIEAQSISIVGTAFALYGLLLGNLLAVGVIYFIL